MTCKHIRKLISDYADGAVGPREREQVREHLAGCAECRRVGEQYAALNEALRAGSQAPVEESYRARFVEGLRPKLGARAEIVRLWPRAGWLLAAGLLVAFGVATGVAVQQSARARDLADRLAQARIVPPQVPAEPVGAPDGDAVADDMKLFSELEATFPGQLNWVATDGDRIDMGLSQGPAATVAAADAGAQVAVVQIAVYEAAEGVLRPLSRMRMVGRDGLSARLSTEAGGLAVHYECRPVIVTEQEGLLRFVVGLGGDGEAGGLVSGEARLAGGAEAEVARIAAGGALYVVRAAIFVMQTRPVPMGRGA